MYLGPHHFQAQNRYFEESVHFATAILWKNAYGFSACQLDADALRNGTVALVHARGIFEDGLTFDIPGCDSLPESRNITGVFPPTADQLTVFLAVPRWLPDGQNCNLQSGQGVNTRYTGVIEMMHDENTGRDEKPVGLTKARSTAMSSSRFSGLPLRKAINVHPGFMGRPLCLSWSLTSRRAGGRESRSAPP